VVGTSDRLKQQIIVGCFIDLQYVDDTLCIGVPTVDNLWTLKALLSGFEMTSGLKVNFHKSSLIGINVPRDLWRRRVGF